MKPAVAIVWLAMLSGYCQAQAIYNPAFKPSQAPLPLMYVRFAGPPGVKVTFYRSVKGTSFETPFVAGFRPGYVYRMQVDNIPDNPGMTLFPTLEVRGSLQLQMRTRNADFPAGLYFNIDDVAVVRAGGLVTKVITLERPDQAIPAASDANQPLEVPVTVRQDPLEEAQLRGKALAVMHLGRRQYTPQELAAEAIAGTVLLPGEKVLGEPASPPRLMSRCYPIIDPIAGPADWTRDVTLYDGGDTPPPAGYSRGKLRGVNPSDTVAEYVDARGYKRVVASNRVGILVPRFVIIRGESTLAEHSMPIALGGTGAVHGRETIRFHQPTFAFNQNQHLDLLKGRERVSSTVASTAITVIGGLESLRRYERIVPGVTTVTANTLGPQTVKPAPDRPLKIDKWPDKHAALIGDVITFSIRCTNQSGHAVRDIVLHEDLTTRFEYIPGTAKNDREAQFTTQPNDAGSLHLRWDLPGELPPGESATVTFQVRVR